jgi:hypothetical protein
VSTVEVVIIESTADWNFPYSYAAGIGAGNQVDWSCSRYDGSYANMVASQLDVPKEALDFTYTACSGAVVKEITQQAEKLSSDQQFIMLSAVRLLTSNTKHPADLVTRVATMPI